MDYLKFKNKILDYFKDLPSHRIDQGEGMYDEDCGCCVGAHLAYIANEPLTYGEGRRFFFESLKKFLGMDEDNTRRFFKEVNDPEDDYTMFGAVRWNEHPYKIFKKMFDLMDGGD